MPNASDSSSSEPPERIRFEQLREAHPRFHYESCTLERRPETQSPNIHREDPLRVRYRFRLEPDIEFSPSMVIHGVDWDRVNRLPPQTLENLFFHLGLVEALSYWKAACAPEIVVEAGALDTEQTAWWHKLLLRGMGEFFFVNRIDFRPAGFVKIVSSGPSRGAVPLAAQAPQEGKLNLVLSSGGKDTVVSLQLLRAAGEPFDCLQLNPTKAAMAITGEAECGKPILVRRTLDPHLIELNEQGYWNGHTPFSALLAFLGVAVAVLFGHKRVLVSNERSAEEPSIEYLGHPINHQYSKSYEFETDFRDYARKYLTAEVEYFSLLRPLYELQIARLFAGHQEYFQLFRSCNRGAGTNSWCGECPKCLSVYAMLYPFLDREQMLTIFRTGLFFQDDAEPVLEALLGMDRAKPFECVGTREEMLAALHLSVERFREQGIALPGPLREIEARVLARRTDLPELARNILSGWTGDHNIPSELGAALQQVLTKALERERAG
jgi:hypothetical protein